MIGLKTIEHDSNGLITGSKNMISMRKKITGVLAALVCGDCPHGRLRRPGPGNHLRRVHLHAGNLPTTRRSRRPRSSSRPLAPNTGGDNTSNNAAKKNTTVLYPLPDGARERGTRDDPEALRRYDRAGQGDLLP